MIGAQRGGASMMGHWDVETTMVATHVLNLVGGRGIENPPDGALWVRRQGPRGF